MATESKVRHLAIIMDGNGRWAQQHNLPRIEGHKAGARRVFDIMEEVQKFKIEYLTLYTFSTENWKRSPAEVAGLMNLLETELETRLPELMARGVRLKTIGRTAGLWNGPRVKLEKAIEATQNNRNGTLILALNYGGRAEIADAAQRIAQDAANGKLNPGSITEKTFANYLYDPELPDPELMIRTSGELRLSNFLLWQLSYSELYVTDTYWPDFDGKELQKALESFGGRERRFGGR